MKRVKFIGKVNKVRLSLEKTDGIPEILETVYSTEDKEIGTFDLEETPSKGEVFALDDSTDVKVVSVKKFLNGDVVVHTNAILGKIIDEQEEEILNKYKALETKKFVEDMKINNQSFIEFLNLIGGDGMSDEDLLKKYKAMNGMLKARDGFFLY